MTITVADYIVKRLQYLGIKEVFGLPGDYNFNILDAVIKNPKINWINSTNELNAGYAADGYARINGFGAVITTFGVGELSAVNGIAGAYAECVPVMKIVGVPKTADIKENKLIHHNFAKPDYHAFKKVYENVTNYAVCLDDNNAIDIKEKIDKAFDVFVKYRQPVYIALPIDICNSLIDDNIPPIEIKSDLRTLKEVTGKIAELINASKNPLVIVDYLAKRYRIQNEVREISEKFNLTVTSLIMGKGLIEENDSHFIGINLGKAADEDFIELYKDFDLVIGFGTLFSDLNTLGFSVLPDERFRIDIQKDHVIIDGKRFDGVFIDEIIKEILNTDKIVKKPENATNLPKIGYKETPVSDAPLKMDDIFPTLQNFLEDGDTVTVETGIISFASAKMKLGANSNYLSQPMWGSIGWATPAAFGAGLADKTKRLILFTGEGSHQLTIQELANMFKYDIRPIILVLNNSGYTVERYLSNDPNDPFNDITPWNYKKALELFCGSFDSKLGNGGTVCSNDKTCDSKRFFYHGVKTSKELGETLLVAKDEQKKGLVYIELFTDKMDIPQTMHKVMKGVRGA